MLKIYPNSLIYVHAPGDYSTGGVELLHQLVDALRNHGRKAYIVYYGNDTQTITKAYSHYNIEIKQNAEIDDNFRNIEIYTETNVKSLKKNVRKTQKMIWWLSVDNYYVSNENHLGLYDMFVWDKRLAWGMFKHRLKRLLKFRKNEFIGNVSLVEFVLKGYSFGYQCEYIKSFLHKFGILKPLGLSDYINIDFVDKLKVIQKRNRVLYNPSKGYKFTKRLMEIAPDIEWVPLKGYSREQLLEVISQAKLYIDFGNHPGKDRLPRECAMGRCCIITGMRGSAAYYKDLPIPSEYKFDESVIDISEVIKKIRSTLAHYDTAIDDFAKYRNSIKMEKCVFEDEVMRIFSC